MLNEQTAADLDKIVSEAKRVAELIDSMKRLTMNAAEPAERVKLDIGELIRQTAALYRPILERSGVVLSVDVEAGLTVHGSAEELTQVVFNVLQNAKEHTESGNVSIRAASENAHVVIVVSDTGTGIAHGILAHAFERGVTGKEGGTGMGLAICKAIMDAHCGAIRIANREQGGAAVTLTLPEYGEGVSDEPAR